MRDGTAPMADPYAAARHSLPTVRVLGAGRSLGQLSMLEAQLSVSGVVITYLSMCRNEYKLRGQVLVARKLSATSSTRHAQSKQVAETSSY